MRIEKAERSIELSFKSERLKDICQSGRNINKGRQENSAADVISSENEALIKHFQRPNCVLTPR